MDLLFIIEIDEIYLCRKHKAQLLCRTNIKLYQKHQQFKQSKLHENPRWFIRSEQFHENKRKLRHSF
jgi:hypothetical protein